MYKPLKLDILPQPDLTTCGPTCLHAVYRYFGDEIPLERVIRETHQLEDGGTLAVWLGCHALRRGYQARIYTFNLTVFDPTWFRAGPPRLAERLETQMRFKEDAKLRAASLAYLEFLQLGGEIRMRDLNSQLLLKYLRVSIPILTGLSATYLYRCEREYGPQCQPDDIRGVSAGHFVVLCGLDHRHRKALVADPYLPNPLGPEHHYEVDLQRVICAVLLGVLTYDANLLIVQPSESLRR